MPKKPSMKQLLAIANEKRGRMKKLKEFGFWRISRDEQKHIHLLNKMIKRMRK